MTRLQLCLVSRRVHLGSEPAAAKKSLTVAWHALGAGLMGRSAAWEVPCAAFTTSGLTGALITLRAVLKVNINDHLGFWHKERVDDYNVSRTQR